MYLFGVVHLIYQCWRGKGALCLPHPLRPLRRRGRLINRPLQPMKTGGNNPDKRQIWTSHTKPISTALHFSKAHQGEERQSWTRVAAEFVSLWLPCQDILSDGRWPKPHSLFLWHTNCFTQCLLCFPTHTHSCTSSHTVLHFPTRSHGATVDHLPSYCWCACQAFCSHTAHMRFTIVGTDWNSWNSY